LGRVAREKKLEIAVLTVPAAAAAEVAHQVAAARIPAVLNFAPVQLQLPAGIMLRQVDFASELEALTYHLRKA
jgi:redox-sensing transcriptional repressor